MNKKCETPQRNLRRFLRWREPEKKNVSFYEIERFVLLFRNVSFCGLYSFYNDLPTSEKNILQVKACILFKSLYEEDTKNRYRPISLWLCNNYSLLCPNIRDEFSAGGKCTIINGERLTNPYPHIVKELLRCHEQIKYILRNPDEDIIRGIHDFWDFTFDEDDYYNSWLNMVEECFKLNPTLSFIPIRELLDSDAKPF